MCAIRLGRSQRPSDLDRLGKPCSETGIPFTAANDHNRGRSLSAHWGPEDKVSQHWYGSGAICPAGGDKGSAVGVTTGSPTSARPWLEDRRRLGVRVTRAVLRSVSEIQEVPLDHPRLSEGWWEVERDGASISRWTNGRALLPLPMLSEVATLEICFSGVMTYIIGSNESPTTKRSIAE